MIVRFDQNITVFQLESMSMLRFMFRFAVVITSGFMMPATFGQATATIPRAEVVLDQYVEATGGKAAYEKFTNRVSTGTLDIVGANLKGTIKVTHTSPNKLVSVTELGPIGTTRQGTDGEVAWEISTISGERILEAEERDAFILQAVFNGEIRWKDRYEKVESVGVEDVEGKPAVKLVLTPKSGKPLIEYYDLKTHLLVKQVIKTKGPMGEISIDQYPGNYRKIDGVLMPLSLKQKVLGQEMVLNFTDVSHNVKLADNTFALPKEIVSIKKKKAK